MGEGGEVKDLQGATVRERIYSNVSGQPPAVGTLPANITLFSAFQKKRYSNTTSTSVLLDRVTFLTHTPRVYAIILLLLCPSG